MHEYRFADLRADPDGRTLSGGAVRGPVRGWRCVDTGFAGFGAIHERRPAFRRRCGAAAGARDTGPISRVEPWSEVRRGRGIGRIAALSANPVSVG